jgi:hypothetical protein
MILINIVLRKRRGKEMEKIDHKQTNKQIQKVIWKSIYQIKYI